MRPQMRDVTIAVRDLERSMPFCRDLLELPVVRDSVDGEGRRNRWLSAGPGLVRLVEAGSSASPTISDRAEPIEVVS